jgi:small subunit ribosomal protein S17
MTETQGATAPAEQEARKQRTQKVGRVVSNKMDKSVVVAVDFVRRHPLYHKRITKTSKFVAHDPNNECGIGDVVRIEECRPLSKTKRWVVRETLEKGVEI